MPSGRILIVDDITVADRLSELLDSVGLASAVVDSFEAALGELSRSSAVVLADSRRAARWPSAWATTLRDAGALKVVVMASAGRSEVGAFERLGADEVVDKSDLGAIAAAVTVLPPPPEASSPNGA